jgi:hypothetical protein
MVAVHMLLLVDKITQIKGSTSEEGQLNSVLDEQIERKD